MKPLNLLFASACIAFAASAIAADNSDKSRVGSCEDAKKQQDYFCDTSNSANDTMVALGTACNNAKKNVAEACEGKRDADPVYK